MTTAVCDINMKSLLWVSRTVRWLENLLQCPLWAGCTVAVCHLIPVFLYFQEFFIFLFLIFPGVSLSIATIAKCDKFAKVATKFQKWWIWMATTYFLLIFLQYTIALSAERKGPLSVYNQYRFSRIYRISPCKIRPKLTLLNCHFPKLATSQREIHTSVQTYHFVPHLTHY